MQLVAAETNRWRGVAAASGDIVMVLVINVGDDVTME